MRAYGQVKGRNYGYGQRIVAEKAGTARVYVCGPVTGIADLNRPAFDDAAKRLRQAGMEPILPHSFVPGNASHAKAMRLCLTRLCEGDIDMIAVLPGYRESHGALLEIAVADGVGVPVCQIDVLLEKPERPIVCKRNPGMAPLLDGGDAS